MTSKEYFEDAKLFLGELPDELKQIDNFFNILIKSVSDAKEHVWKKTQLVRTFDCYLMYFVQKAKKLVELDRQYEFNRIPELVYITETYNITKEICDKNKEMIDTLRPLVTPDKLYMYVREFRLEKVPANLWKLRIEIHKNLGLYYFRKNYDQYAKTKGVEKYKSGKYDFYISDLIKEIIRMEGLSGAYASGKLMLDMLSGINKESDNPFKLAKESIAYSNAILMCLANIPVTYIGYEIVRPKTIDGTIFDQDDMLYGVAQYHCGNFIGKEPVMTKVADAILKCISKYGHDSHIYFVEYFDQDLANFPEIMNTQFIVTKTKNQIILAGIPVKFNPQDINSDFFKYNKKSRHWLGQENIVYGRVAILKSVLGEVGFKDTGELTISISGSVSKNAFRDKGAFNKLEARIINLT